MFRNKLILIAGGGIILVVLLAVIWILMPARDEHAAEHKFADKCMEWNREGGDLQYLAGPDISRACSDYLARRSDADRGADDARWKTRMEEARKEWDRAGKLVRPPGPAG